LRRIPPLPLQTQTNQSQTKETTHMNIKRILAIVFILACTAAGWVILGTSLAVRSSASGGALERAVTAGWGPPMSQAHPVIFYSSPGVAGGRHYIQPGQSDVNVALKYEPKKKGLLWHRTYVVDFRGAYVLENPTPITQTLYVKFEFPAKEASYTDFVFTLDGKASTDERKTSEGITEAVTLDPGKTAKLEVAYKTRGTDRWGYTFGDTTRIRHFNLTMSTDFAEIDFPAGTGSAQKRDTTAKGWKLEWSYPDVIGAQPVGMEMPKALNPGPVASRITFFAPVSLLFFFAVLLIAATVRCVNLHPMNYFAFQLLFAYLVDLMPLLAAFVIAAVVSLALVSGYLLLAAGKGFARIAAAAQFAYMVLFSYSFFFDGLTGLTITIGAIITLAILMATTARINWSEKFTSRPAGVMPPPIPQR
jgi:hypothetical protein